MESKPTATEEQRRYAVVLDTGMKAGLVLLVLTFVLYVFGLIKPHVPVDEISNYWGMKVDEYLDHAGIEKGWAWIGNLSKSDFLNFVPIAFLAAVTVICYLTIIPIFFKKKDVVYTILTFLEVMVLALAASGVLPTGGH